MILKGKELLLTLTVLLTSAFAATALEVLQPWENDSKNIENLIKIAQNVTNFHPNSRWYGLGQKAAWILKTMEILSAERPKMDDTFHDFHYIPFSESFEEEKRQKSGNFTVVYSKIIPQQDQINHYRSLLREIGLDPMEIYTQFKLFKRKTVIVDFTDPERLIVLFTKILLDWAKEHNLSLEEAVKVVTVSPSYQGATLPVRFLFIDEGEMYLTCKNVYGDNHLLEALSNATEEIDNSSNLLSSYLAEDWVEPIHQLPSNDRIKRIIEKLIQFVKEYLKNVALVSSPVVTKTSPGKVKLVSGQGKNQISLEIPSMSDGTQKACENRDYFTSDQWKNVPANADPEERNVNIVFEPLYLIFTYNTTHVRELNRNVLQALSEEYAATNMQDHHKKSLFEFIMDEIKKPSSTSRYVLDLVCKNRFPGYKAAPNSVFVEQYLSAKFENFRKTNIVDDTKMILRSSPNDTDILQEMDFQVPLGPQLPAFLSYCSVQFGSRRRRRAAESSVSKINLFESFEDNPIYMMLTYDTKGEKTLNAHIYKVLWAQYALTSQNNSFIDFIQEEINNSTSLSGKILEKICKKKHAQLEYNVEEESSTDSSNNENAESVKSYGKSAHYIKSIVSASKDVLNWFDIKLCQAKLALSIVGLWYLDRCYDEHARHAAAQ